MTRRIIPHAPDTLLDPTVLMLGEIALAEGTARPRFGNGAKPGGNVGAFLDDLDPLSERIDLVEGTVTSGRLAYALYSALALNTTAPVGAVAEVPITDTGQHTDPVVGGTVNNSGVFKKEAAGWQRLYDVDAAAAGAARDQAIAARDIAVNAAAALPSGNGQNLWYDPFFKRLRAAYSTPAATMMLNGLRRFSAGGSTLSWEAADNAYGSRGLIVSANIADFNTWLSEFGVAPGEQVNEVLRVIISTGTTWTFQPVIQDAAMTSNLVVGATVTVAGTGAVQEVALAGLVTPADGSGATLRVRASRTVGSGTLNRLAMNMFQGSQRRPISKVDLLGDVSDNTSAVKSMSSAFPSILEAVSAWAENVSGVTRVEGSYIDSGGNIIPASNTRYAEYNLPTSGIPKVRATATLGAGAGFWLYNYYTGQNGTGALAGHEVQGNGSTDVLYPEKEMTLVQGADGLYFNGTLVRSVRINGRPSTTITVDILKPLPDLAQRVVDGLSSGSGFAGKPWVSYGHSIVGQGRWQPYLTAALGLGAHTNCGLGGSACSKPDVSGTAISMCDDVRVNAIPTSTRLILLLPFTNDFGQSRPRGQLSSIDATAFDNTTVYGAAEEMVTKIMARAPNAMIVWLTDVFGRNQKRVVEGLWRSPYYNRQPSAADIAAGRPAPASGSPPSADFIGLDQEAYRDVARNVARKYGQPVIELCSMLGWNKYNAAPYYEADPDGDGNSTTLIHPNSDPGGRAMAAVIGDGLLAHLNHLAALLPA